MPGVIKPFVEEQQRDARQNLFEEFYLKAVQRGTEDPSYRPSRDALNLHEEASREGAKLVSQWERSHPGLNPVQLLQLYHQQPSAHHAPVELTWRDLHPPQEKKQKHSQGQKHEQRQSRSRGQGMEISA